MITLLVIGACFFIFAFVQIIRVLIKFLQAIYYRKFANEKQVDEGFKKHVIKESEDYKSFEDKLDKKLRHGI